MAVPVGSSVAQHAFGASDVLGERACVVANAVDEARLAGTLEVEAEGVQAGCRGDAAFVDDLAPNVENGNV